MCLLPDLVEIEESHLADVYLKDCVDLVRSVRDLESPY